MTHIETESSDAVSRAALLKTVSLLHHQEPLSFVPVSGLREIPLTLTVVAFFLILLLLLLLLLLLPLLLLFLLLPL